MCGHKQKPLVGVTVCFFYSWGETKWLSGMRWSLHQEPPAFRNLVLAPDPDRSRNGIHRSQFPPLLCTLRLRCLTGFVTLDPLKAPYQPCSRTPTPFLIIYDCVLPSAAPSLRGTGFQLCSISHHCSCTHHMSVVMASLDYQLVRG